MHRGGSVTNGATSSRWGRFSVPTQVVHPLELLHDGHGARRLHSDDHPDGVTEEVASGLQVHESVS